MILCCGEALIDMIPEQTVQGSEGYVPRSGGAIFNTAIGLGRLGCRTGLLSGISTDMFGHQLMADLRASNVDTRHVIRSGRPSTLAFVKLSDGHASYSFFDENSAGRMIAPTDLPTTIDGISALYFGGISLACTPGADTYMHFAQAHAPDAVVMVDPNIRPSFITDEPSFRDRINGMLSLADIVKVSDEDLNWIMPDTRALEEKVSQLQALGPSVVILTRGSSGAQAWLPDGHSIFVASQKAVVVDTVGAGDTFNAGVLANLSDAGRLSKTAIQEMSESDLVNAITFGARVAAINVGRAGANPPWRDEL
ncbi:carbohydrate kinase family protein [Aliiroseovarius lamellibrachiae]|uniref:carbohydrate kinase family protein n=1 Tax=Aliiroseovarius lamellibrachiae TaxID=1924933 RepID=UPI001BE05198|nr:carbohydrate kinase [Aliiroseovarius lamellibrachiae]MBT2131531.1 carbohydrate kinase [Aliiroseovarius lamellibrachiae]